MKRASKGGAMIALAVTALSLGGCAFGLGSAFVGQWSPRQEVEFEACLTDASAPGVSNSGDGCKERKEVVADVPGRRFWGVVLPLLQIGPSWVSYDGEEETQIRFQPALELMRGKGRWAYGVRTGIIFDSSGKTMDGPDGEPVSDPYDSMSAFDVTAMGHVSIVDRLSLYGGLGYLPWADARDQTTSVGGRGLLGFQLALSKTHSSNFIVLSMEIDRIYLRLDETYRSTGVTGTIGLYF